MVVCLGFGWRDVADGLQQPVMVEPRNPFERGQHDRLFGLAQPMASPHLLALVVLSSDLHGTPSLEMPGVASDLDRHEWIKHGTCSGLIQQDFFTDALSFLANVSGENPRSFVAANGGNTVQLGDLVQAVTNDYGAAGVEFLCDSSSGQQMLTGIRLHWALHGPDPQLLDPAYRHAEPTNFPLATVR